MPNRLKFNRVAPNLELSPLHPLRTRQSSKRNCFTLGSFNLRTPVLPINAKARKFLKRLKSEVDLLDGRSRRYFLENWEGIDAIADQEVDG